jgi:hypothetical protein
MAGGGFVYNEGTRGYMKPYAAPTSTTYLPGSVMVYSSSETLAVSTTVDDTALCILLGGAQPYADDDYCATTFAGLEVAFANGDIVWVRAEDANSFTFMCPVYNAQTANTAGTVETSNSNSATMVGWYVCDKDKNFGADRTTTSAGELIGVMLGIYTEAT